MVQTAQEAAGTIYGNLQKKKKRQIKREIYFHSHPCFSPLLIHNFGFFLQFERIRMTHATCMELRQLKKKKQYINNSREEEEEELLSCQTVKKHKISDETRSENHIFCM